MAEHSLISLKLKIFKIRRTDISVFPCVICFQLLLLCFPEVVSMNTFPNDQIKEQTNKRFIIVIKYNSF